jgi:hypothetical protein
MSFKTKYNGGPLYANTNVLVIKCLLKLLVWLNKRSSSSLSLVFVISYYLVTFNKSLAGLQKLVI